MDGWTPNMRRARAFVVDELRGIGRELVAGSWSRGARPLTVHEACAVMGGAMALVVEQGLKRAAVAVFDAVGDVVAAFDD